MYSRKLSCLILSVFTLIVLVASLLSSTDQLQQRGRLVIGSSLVADGNPLPPLPPSPKPPAQPAVVADGNPLPPLPPSPKPPAIYFHV